ncbi:hypothetical protein D3C78_1035140 [compost metagenome]
MQVGLGDEVARCEMRGLHRQFLDRLHGQRAVGGDGFSQCHGGRQQLLAAHQVADQADALGFLRIDARTGQGHLHRVGRRNGAQQVLHTTHRRDARHLGFRQREGRALGGDAQVALQRQFQAAAQAVAIDRGDHRLPDLQVVEVDQAGVATLLRLRFQALQRTADETAGRRHGRLEIGTGAERALAAAGKHDGAHLVIVLAAGKHPAQAQQVADGQGIERLRRVKGDDRDVPVDLELDGHGSFLRRSGWTASGHHRRTASGR